MNSAGYVPRAYRFGQIRRRTAADECCQLCPCVCALLPIALSNWHISPGCLVCRIRSSPEATNVHFFAHSPVLTYLARQNLYPVRPVLQQPLVSQPSHHNLLKSLSVSIYHSAQPLPSTLSPVPFLPSLHFASIYFV